MICPHFMNSRSTFLNIALLLMLSSCSALWGENLHPVEEKRPAESVTRQTSRSRAYFGQMQWAVQNYEAGEYKKAIPQFDKLRSYGTEVPNYEFIPFYLGMSHFRLDNLEMAKIELKQFLQQKLEHNHGQEARMALLTIFEREKNWDALLGMAAETDKLTLFQNNRAYLKLLWARALVEKGEKKSADAILKESQQFLDSSDYRSGRSLDIDTDLWGRYAFTYQLLKANDCSQLDPKTIGKGKTQKRLYQPWLDSQTDCFSASLKDLAENLLKKESPWSTPSLQIYGDSLDRFIQKIRSFQVQERSKLETSRALTSSARQNLYRLMGRVDEWLEVLATGTNERSLLLNLRSRIDQSIAQIGSNEKP